MSFRGSAEPNGLFLENIFDLQFSQHILSAINNTLEVYFMLIPVSPLFLEQYQVSLEIRGNVDETWAK
jgi:hypothetical protein